MVLCIWCRCFVEGCLALLYVDVTLAVLQQASTRRRRALPSAMPVLPSRTRTLLEATTLPTACATLGTRAQTEEAARHALRASTRTHSGAPSVQTARQVSSREEQHARDDSDRGHRPRRSRGAGARGARDGNARAEHGGASSALFDDDAESDAYLGWQATTRTRQGLTMVTRDGRQLLGRGRVYLLPCLPCLRVHARCWKRQRYRLRVQRW